MKTINIDEASKKLKELIKQVNENNEEINIKSDKNSAVLISEREYNSIVETLYLTGSPANAKRLRESIEQVNKANK